MSSKNLNEVLERVTNLSKNYEDHLINKESISFNSLDEMSIDGFPHPVNHIAQSSVCYRLGIPLNYLKRCPQDIQQINMNHWIEKEKNDQLFIRFDGSNVRALFTPKYKPIDNIQIIDKLISDGIYDLNSPVEYYLDSDFMSLSFPDDKKSFSVNGDDMKGGITISNSEVGMSCLHISAFILRLVCTNGLVSSKKVSESYKHISEQRIDDLPKAILKVSSEMDNQYVNFGLSIEDKVEDPEEVFNNFNRKYHISKAEKEAIEWAWPLEFGDTMFNIINTYTRASKFEDLNAFSSHKLQEVGGNILSLVNK